jgi:chromosome segregation ATPase
MRGDRSIVLLLKVNYNKMIIIIFILSYRISTIQGSLKSAQQELQLVRETLKKTQDELRVTKTSLGRVESSVTLLQKNLHHVITSMKEIGLINESLEEKLSAFKGMHIVNLIQLTCQPMHAFKLSNYRYSS